MTEPDQWSWDGVNQPPAPWSPGVAPGSSPPEDVPAPLGADPAGSRPPVTMPAAPPGPPAWQSYAAQQRAAGGGPSPYGTVSYRPGIIALRPLGFGEFFDGSFRAIQHNPQVMFGLSLLVAVVLGVIEAALFGSALGQLLEIDPESTAVPLGPLGAVLGGGVVAGIVSMLATIVLNGLLVTSVSQSILGRRVSIGAVWHQSKGQLWRLVGLSLLIGAIQIAVIGAAIALFALLAAGAFAIGSDAVWVGVVLGLLILFAAAVLVAFFYVRLGLASPVLMMERTGVTAAIRRSWQLTAGWFWRNLGVILVASIITSAISGFASMPISVATSGLVSLGTEFLWVSGVVAVLLSALLSALITPFLASITALLYVDIRMRKEGLDVELIRAVGDSL